MRRASIDTARLLLTVISRSLSAANSFHRLCVDASMQDGPNSLIPFLAMPIVILSALPSTALARLSGYSLTSIASLGTTCWVMVIYMGVIMIPQNSSEGTETKEYCRLFNSLGFGFDVPSPNASLILLRFHPVIVSHPCSSENASRFHWYSGYEPRLTTFK